MNRGNYHWEGHLPVAGRHASSSPRSKLLGLAGTVAFVAGLDFVAPRHLTPPKRESDGDGDGGGDCGDSGGGSAEGGGGTIGTAPQFRTYWTDTCQEPAVRRLPLLATTSDGGGGGAAGGGSRRRRVVVIGGGMAGLHTALALAESSSSCLSSNKSLADAKKPPPSAAASNGEPATISGSDVMILEASNVGSSAGASGLSKGLVVPGIQVPRDDLAQRVGGDVAGTIYRLTYAAEDRLRGLIARYGIRCRPEAGGGLVEASIHDPDDEDGGDDDDKEDDGCTPLTADGVQTMLGTDPALYKRGEYDPSCSGVDPLGLTRGLARACEERGVTIHEDTRAVGIEKIGADRAERTLNGGGGKDALPPLYRVTTSTGASVECDHVVLCSGAEAVSPGLSKRLSRSVIPVYTWMACTAPLGDKLPVRPVVESSANPDSATTASSTPAVAAAGLQPPQPQPQSQSQPRYPMGGDDFVALHYWRFTPCGRLMFGALADAYPMPAWLAERRLRRALGTVYPQLRDAEFESVWGGPLALSRRAVPLIGRDADFDYDVDVHSSMRGGGVWYATGFAGHGIVPTAMAGRVLAAAIVGGQAGDDDAEPSAETWRLFQEHCPPEGTGWPVGRMGTQLALASYGVLDWLRVRGVPVPKVSKPW